MATVYVDPRLGSNQNSGQQNAPFKTLTYALRQVGAGSHIQLQPGTYSADSGEGFPLRIPEGVIVTGNATNHGRNITLYGGGAFRSSEFGGQWATVLLENSCDLRGVTVTNPLERGTGIWIESASPTVAYCTLKHCRREGVFVLGQSAPLVHNCRIETNAASGVFMARRAKGELRHNRVQNTGYGVAISDQAAPLVIDNQFLDNRSGLVISRSARPVLRENLIARSQGDGLVVLDNALPDLGDREEPGRNVFEASRGFDVRNQTAMPLRIAGNQINPVKVSGTVVQEALVIPPVVVRSSGGSEPPSLPPSLPPSSPPPSGSPPTAPVFPDVVSHWARPFIEALANRNLIRGFPDGTFRPAANLTRAEYAALLTQSFDQPDRRLNQGFSDVPDAFWAATAIRKAERMGFIAGFPDGTFRPQEPLTRLQILLSLVNGLALQGGSTTSLNVYQDRAEIPSYAVSAVAIATQQQLVVNYPNPNVLEPSISASRAETAAILYQALVATGRAAFIPSPYIVIPSAASATFADVQSQWAAPYVQGMASQGYMGGFTDGTFRPTDPVSRAHYAVWLDQSLGLGAEPSDETVAEPTAETVAARPETQAPSMQSSPWADLSSDDWAYASIQRVVGAGWLTPKTESQFAPDARLTHADLWLSVATRLGVQTSSPPQTAQQAIAQLRQLGLQLPPTRSAQESDRPATREEVAALLYQGLVYLNRAEAIAPLRTATAAAEPGEDSRDERLLPTETPSQSAASLLEPETETAQRLTSGNRKRSALVAATASREVRSRLPALKPMSVVVALGFDVGRDAHVSSARRESLQRMAGAVAKDLDLCLRRQGLQVQRFSPMQSELNEELPIEKAQTAHSLRPHHVAVMVSLQQTSDVSVTDHGRIQWRIQYAASEQEHGQEQPQADAAVVNAAVSERSAARAVSDKNASDGFASEGSHLALAKTIYWSMLEHTDLSPSDLALDLSSRTPAEYPYVEVQFFWGMGSSDMKPSEQSLTVSRARSGFNPAQPIALHRWGEAIARGILSYVQQHVSPH